MRAQPGFGWQAISSSISVERYTSAFQAGVEGALPSCSTISGDANTGASQDFTGLAAAVQLRLRVAVFADGHQGLQALQRCSGLLNRRARGSTVATHHFAEVAQQRQQEFRKLPGAFAPRECESLHRLQFRGRNGRLKNSGEVCWASSLNGISAFCDPPSNFCSRGIIISAPRFERGGCR